MKILTDQLRQFRLEKSFVETDLQRYQDKLTQLANQLIQWFNNTIQEDSRPPVYNIQSFLLC